MKKEDIELLSNDTIPENVRATIADNILNSADREIGRQLEFKKLNLTVKNYFGIRRL